MNKDEYKSAMGKIKASNELKYKVENLMKLSNPRIHTFKRNRLVLAFVALLMFVCICTAVVLPSMLKDTVETDAINDFKIIGSTSKQNACYAAIVYIDGYEYAPSAWLKYSRYDFGHGLYEKVRGDKLGEITLDLKGKKYTGIPPSFSSTYDIGTEIYTIKNIKKERAILVVDNNNNASIIYRERKSVLNEKEPINLTMVDIFDMISDSSEVSAVELRDESDGSFMRTSKNEYMLSLINNELRKLALLNKSELGKNPYDMNNRIPINLMFEDGAALHMQIFPEAKYAYVFGGFVNISTELCVAIKELFEQGEQYPSISNLLPYTESTVSYMYFVNHMNGDEVLCENPAWSSSALFSIFHYYRVEEVKMESGLRAVVTSTIGESKNKSITINFYETKDKNIIIEFNGHYYKPVKGQMMIDELEEYLYNSTDLGLKQ